MAGVREVGSAPAGGHDALSPRVPDRGRRGTPRDDGAGGRGSWAARLGWLNLQGTPLAFLGAAVTPWIFTVAALGELVNDKLPKTGSRKAPPAFIARIVMGALCGAAVGAGPRARGRARSGALGAVAGTLGGYEFRARLARAAGRDLPIALLEDAVAIALAFWIVRQPHSERVDDELQAADARPGMRSSPITVGSYSDTVGWMCMARWMTV